MAIWDEHLEVARALPRLASGVSDAVDLIYCSLAAGGQLLIAGNGGSAADAQHIAAELTGRFQRERRRIDRFHCLCPPGDMQGKTTG